MRLPSAALLLALLALSSTAHAVEAVDDTTPPAVTITFPTADEVIPDDSAPTFTGEAGTEAGDAATVTVEIFTGASATGTPRESLVRPVVDGAWSTKPETNLPQGQFTLRVLQQDASGNVGTATATFWIDLFGPFPYISRPLEDWAFQDRTPRFHGWPGTAEGDAPSVTLEIVAGEVDSGTPLETQTLEADGVWETSALTELPDGVYTLFVSQEDDAGHTGTAVAFFRIDNVAPELALTNPGGSVRSLKPILSGTSGTARGDHTHVEVALFGGSSATGVPIHSDDVDGADGTWAESLPAALTEGFYTVRVRQVDSAENVTEVVRTFRVDMTAPVVPTVDTPVAGAQLHDTRPELAGSAGSAPGDNPTVTVQLTRDGRRMSTFTLPVTGGRWAGRPEGDLRPGNYTVTVTHSDDARNRSAPSAAHPFTILPPPTVLPPAPDVIAPAVALPRTISRRGRLLLARVSFGEAVTATASLRLGRTVLARKTGVFTGDLRPTFRLKPSRKALARLLRSRRRPTLVVRATDQAGNAHTARGTVKLKR